MDKYNKVVYNPELSVADNAKANNITQEEMRYYMRSRGIDRRNTERQPYILKIREYLKEHPTANRKETASAIGIGINTTRKYWDIAVGHKGIKENSRKASIRKNREQRAINFLDSLPLEFLKKYVAKRERTSISFIAPSVTEVPSVTENSITQSPQRRALILDFDMTLFDTRIGMEARESKDWDKVYSLIPQYKLYDGWREVLDWCKKNDVKVAIVSGAKTELIKRTLEHHNVEVDAVVGFQLYQQKPNRRLVNQALKKLGGVLRKNVISVGDALKDKQMSDNARVKFIGAIWDCEQQEHTEELKKGDTITRPNELIQLLNKMDITLLPASNFKVVKYNERTSKSQSPFYGEIAYNDTHAYFYQGVSLSNWAMSVPPIPYDGHQFNSSEALFMYLKCKGMGSDKVAIKIVEADNDETLVGNAKFDAVKQLGRKAKFNKDIYLEKREEWMYTALKAKYEADETFRTILMDDRYKGKTFAEAADADDIWGIGTYITEEVLAFNEAVWMGDNLLGRALTRVRDEHL